MLDVMEEIPVPHVKRLDMIVSMVLRPVREFYRFTSCKQNVLMKIGGERVT